MLSVSYSMKFDLSTNNVATAHYILKKMSYFFRKLVSVLYSFYFPNFVSQVCKIQREGRSSVSTS